MNNSPRKFTAKKTIFVVLASFVILGVLGYWLYPYVFPAPKPAESLQERIERLAREDRDKLLQKKASTSELYGSLVRLAQMQDPVARQEAVSYAKHEDAMMREAACVALGYFGEPEALSLLDSLSQDKTPSVRMRAIQAMGFRAIPEREKLLISILNNKVRPLDELVAAHSALIAATRTEEVKKKSLHALWEIAKTSQAPNIALDAAQKLVAAAPNSEDAVNLFHQTLENSKSSPLSALAIRHLSSINDPWYAKNMAKFKDHENPKIREAYLQSIAHVCPPDRWTLLEHSILNEKSLEAFSMAVNIAATLPSDESKALFDRILASKKLSDKNLAVVTNARQQLEGRNNAIVACQNRGGENHAIILPKDQVITKATSVPETAKAPDAHLKKPKTNQKIKTKK